MSMKPADVGRHQQGGCKICTHPQREEIERDFINWRWFRCISARRLSDWLRRIACRCARAGVAQNGDREQVGSRVHRSGSRPSNLAAGLHDDNGQSLEQRTVTGKRREHPRVQAV
jgi:hypothetical protein